ncbi:PLATZ transcription factor family protein [Medicago truncatula]|uniref:PLATZ transcription factor family protein n=1 Tax=Medicago truncatula TaxID=3880 RepID=G7IM59_MEDTR|nr:PLATZ transcription factor family protein [Medicago truncatula]
MDMMVMPRLKNLLACEVHPNESKNERSSYTDVIKTIEIYKHLDIPGIQMYVISNFTTVFINKRLFPQSMRNKIGIIGCSGDYFV